MADCAHDTEAVEGDRDTHKMEKCADKICYTALAGAKDGFVVDKSKAIFDVIWLSTAYFWALLIVSVTLALPFVRFTDLPLRKRRVPLIYQFCSLLN